MENYKNKKIRLEEEINEMNARYKSIKDVDEILSKYLNFDGLTYEIVNDFIDNILKLGKRTKLESRPS